MTLWFSPRLSVCKTKCKKDLTFGMLLMISAVIWRGADRRIKLFSFMLTYAVLWLRLHYYYTLICPRVPIFPFFFPCHHSHLHEYEDMVIIYLLILWAFKYTSTTRPTACVYIMYMYTIPENNKTEQVNNIIINSTPF